MPVYNLNKLESKLEVKPEDNGGEYRDWENTAEPEYWDDGGSEYAGSESGDVRDSVTGDILPSNLVNAAHEEEIKFMEDWDVGLLVPNEQARKRIGEPPLKGKRVNVTKGDEKHP